MTFAHSHPRDFDALAVDVAASHVLITAILRALAEKAPELYAGVVISTDAELAREAPACGEADLPPTRVGAVASILGAVDRCLSASQWRRAGSEAR